MVSENEIAARFNRLKDTSDVARFFGCSETQVRKYVKEGRLKAVKIGRSLRYTQDAIDAFLATA